MAVAAFVMFTAVLASSLARRILALSEERINQVGIATVERNDVSIGIQFKDSLPASKDKCFEKRYNIQ